MKTISNPITKTPFLLQKKGVVFIAGKMNSNKNKWTLMSTYQWTGEFKCSTTVTLEELTSVEPWDVYDVYSFPVWRFVP